MISSSTQALTATLAQLTRLEQQIQLTLNRASSVDHTPLGSVAKDQAVKAQENAQRAKRDAAESLNRGELDIAA